MKFKVKSDLDIMGVALKTLILLIVLGIIGALIITTVSVIISPLVTIFYSIFVIVFLTVYVIQLVINSITFGSLKEETNTEKLLLKILKEIEISNGNVKTYIEEDDLNSFEKERRERELEVENKKN
ncbi:hypothetical protein [Fusobacterium ulcerans]|uniref:hypothetical protein n=1 Tax=Fusobacterium ulcerans TaxID=861 RepID=UPI0026DCD642|nr:hypothetical protein [Fusobacterium ulcerans]